MVKLPDGSRVRISGTPSRNTKEATELAEREHMDRVLDEARNPHKKEVAPTFKEWFENRFWTEWVVSRKNKPSEIESKLSIFKHHLEPAFGKLPLDKIGPAEIALFRAKLIAKTPKLSDKRINNILTVLSKPLRYAADVGVIARAPKVGLLKVERPEIRWWAFEEYPAILASAKVQGPMYYVAVCLAGEAGLREGEIRALRWQEDVDLVAGTITVNQQTRKGETGTPKGGRRRTIPMTPTLLAALKSLEVVRVGYVVRNLDGTQLRDGQTSYAIWRILDRAKLTERGWHSLRHTFGTHAAMLGVNPWRLQAWLGHRSIEETMLYVHVAEVHQRPIPAEVLAAGEGVANPDRRILAMLGAREAVKPQLAVVDEEAAV